MKTHVVYKVTAPFTGLSARYFKTAKQAGEFVSRNANKGLVGRIYSTQKVRVKSK